MTLVDHLSHFGQDDWTRAVATLAPEIHAIDRNATRVWMAFFSLERAAARRLAEHVATSHTFLYGHRYWPQIKRAILSAAKESSWPGSLPSLMMNIADHATRTTQVDRDQLLGIAAASLMTLRQAGLAAFQASANAVQLPHWAHVRSVRQVRRARVTGPLRPLAFLSAPRFRMRHSEALRTAFVDVSEGQPMAACQGAGCDRCVVGVLSGAEWLSPLDANVEGARLKSLGYNDVKSDDGFSLIRLACVAKPSGHLSFVRINELTN